MKTKSGIRKAAAAVGYVIIGAICVLFAFVFISNLSGNTAFLFGHTAVWIRTDSMEPAIPQRSYILVKKAAAEDVNVGDVIVFRSDDPVLEGALNTHRVTEIIGEHEEFVTKGDNNYVEDQYTAKAENIVGIYEKNLPLFTNFGRFFTTPLGLVATIALVLMILLIMYIPDIRAATRRHSEELDRKKQEQIDELVRLEVEKLKAQNAENGGDHLENDVADVKNQSSVTTPKS